MSKSSSQAKETNPIKEEWNRRKMEKQAQGPFLVRVFNFVKTWAIRLFHTAFLLMFAYLVVAICTLIIPTVMGFVIGSMGYTLNNNAELLLAFLSGIFFTGWVFTGSFVLVKFVWKKYITNIKKTLPDFAADKLDELK